MNINIDEIIAITKINHDKFFKKDIKFINKCIAKRARKGFNCCTIYTDCLYCEPSCFIKYYNDLGFDIERGFHVLYLNWSR